MKKGIVLSLISIMILGILGGCGKDKNDITEESIVEYDDTEDFISAYKEAYSDIEKFENNTVEANDFLVKLWDEVGPNYVYDYLKFVKVTTSPDEFISEWENFGGDAITAQKMMDVMNGIYGYHESILNAKGLAKQNELAAKLQKSMYETNMLFEGLTTDDQDAKVKISELSIKYGEKHQEQISKLNDYYIQVSIMSEKTISPEGSYMNYTSDITSIKTKILETKKTAELY